MSEHGQSEQARGGMVEEFRASGRTRREFAQQRGIAITIDYMLGIGE